MDAVLMRKWHEMVMVKWRVQNFPSFFCNVLFVTFNCNCMLLDKDCTGNATVAEHIQRTCVQYYVSIVIFLATYSTVITS